MSNCKIIIIGDCHMGSHVNNPTYFKYFSKFYVDLFKYIDENKIDTIIQLGDLFDKRKSVDFLALHNAKTCFLTPCEERNIKLYVIPGNHDCYYKSTNEINSVNLLKTPNMVVFDTIPGSDSIYGVDFDFYPWINENNLEVSLNKMKTSRNKFAVGHFEFANFRLHKNQIADSGMDHTIMNNYDLVFSGHYHCISRKHNVLYIGTPYELDWNDFNDKKGFWVYDTIDKELEFIQNEHRLFELYEYDEIDIPDISTAKDKYVKLIIKNRKNQYKYDSFVQNLLLKKPHDLQIIDNEIIESVKNSMNSKVEFQTTAVMINFVIDSMDTNLDKQKLKSMIADIFIEAEEISKI